MILVMDFLVSVADFHVSGRGNRQPEEATGNQYGSRSIAHLGEDDTNSLLMAVQHTFLINWIL